MYEHMRNDFAVQLESFDKDTVNKILLALDVVSLDYDISKKCTELIAYQEWQTPKLVKTYIVSKYSENLSKNSIENYYVVLRRFFDVVRKQPEEITPEHIRLFLIRYKEQKNVSDRSVNQYRVVLNGFFVWLTDNGYITSNPCRNVKRIKCEDSETIYVSSKDLERIRYSCENDMERALVEFLISTGCRCEEVVNTKIHDINLIDGTVKVLGKGRKRRTVFLTDRALYLVNKYINERGFTSDYLFCGIRGGHEKITTRALRKRIDKITGTAGTIEYTPHCFRRACATMLHNNGMDICDIQVYLGHENMDTTGLYVKCCDSELRAKHKKYMR